MVKDNASIENFVPLELWLDDEVGVTNAIDRIKKDELHVLNKLLQPVKVSEEQQKDAALEIVKKFAPRKDWVDSTSWLDDSNSIEATALAERLVDEKMQWNRKFVEQFGFISNDPVQLYGPKSATHQIIIKLLIESKIVKPDDIEDLQSRYSTRKNGVLVKLGKLVGFDHRTLRPIIKAAAKSFKS